MASQTRLIDKGIAGAKDRGRVDQHEVEHVPQMPNEGCEILRSDNRSRIGGTRPRSQHRKTAVPDLAPTVSG